MKNHTVQTGNTVHHFTETDNILDLVPGGVIINGQADTVTEFVQSLELSEKWIPFGFCLRAIYRQEHSKNMTAFLCTLGDKIFTEKL